MIGTIEIVFLIEDLFLWAEYVAFMVVALLVVVGRQKGDWLDYADSQSALFACFYPEWLCLLTGR
jgi:hypothetical protein